MICLRSSYCLLLLLRPRPPIVAHRFLVTLCSQGDWRSDMWTSGYDEASNHRRTDWRCLPAFRKNCRSRRQAERARLALAAESTAAALKKSPRTACSLPLDEDQSRSENSLSTMVSRVPLHELENELQVSWPASDK